MSVFGCSKPVYTAAQALAAVHDEHVQTAAPEAVQAQIRQRVAGFPATAKEALHRAHAVLPQKVATLLQTQPQLVAPAVEAFFYRDDDDVKVRSAARAHESMSSLYRQTQFTAVMPSLVLPQLVTPW